MSKYEEFGIAVKAFRVAANETIEDVSGAVEVDTTYIESIEQGNKLPSEDILQLIISHFALRDHEAKRLITLAGYDEVDFFDDTASESAKDIVEVTLNEGTPVVYTDMVHIASNQFGVIVNFIQGFNGEGKPTIVSRVGMSKEHAKSMMELLQKSLEKADQSEQG